MTTTDLNPTKLTEVYTNMEAALIVAALEAHGIESHLTGEYTSQFRAESLGNVNILVSDADLARAQEVLRDFGNQGDTNSTDEEFYSRLSFRNICRTLIIAGLVATGVSMLVRLVILMFAEL